MGLGTEMLWCWGLQSVRLKMSPGLGGQVMTSSCDGVPGDWEMHAGHGHSFWLISVWQKLVWPRLRLMDPCSQGGGRKHLQGGCSQEQWRGTGGAARRVGVMQAWARARSGRW